MLSVLVAGMLAGNPQPLVGNHLMDITHDDVQEYEQNGSAFVVAFQVWTGKCRGSVDPEGDHKRQRVASDGHVGSKTQTLYLEEDKTLVRVYVRDGTQRKGEPGSRDRLSIAVLEGVDLETIDPTTWDDNFDYSVWYSDDGLDGNINQWYKPLRNISPFQRRTLTYSSQPEKSRTHIQRINVIQRKVRERDVSFRRYVRSWNQRNEAFDDLLHNIILECV